MTDDELREAMERVTRERQATPPVPREHMWEQIRARRAASPRPWVSRRASAGLFAVAASLLLIVGGVALRRHAGSGRAAAAMNSAFADVVRRHLEQSDAMIQDFRAAAAAGRWDDSLTARARDLELATRRIQAGQIGADSTVNWLLGDLDLVMTEIAGYGDLAEQRGAESEMIEFSIRARQVEPRLRSVSLKIRARAEDVVTAAGFEP